VYSLNAQGQEYLEEFSRTWSFLTERLEQLREGRQIDMATGWTEQKRRYRQYKARTKRLPANYHTAIDALERYLEFFGPGKGDSLLPMLEDLADLFEQSAANRTPIREIVGEDPVEFAEAFLRNYPEGQWISRERERLTAAIEHAAGNEGISR
jgi:DNA-binding ferritin-like protein (Dps family)